MTENATINRIINPFLFGNIIISLCTVSLFLQTYLLLGIPFIIDALSYLVFFATLFLYNFHRLLGARRIKPEDQGIITRWAANHKFTLFMLTVIGAGGVGVFIFQTSLQVFIILAVLGCIAVLYELPVVRHHKKFQQLRNLWVHKVFMITTVWSVATVILPVINAEIPLTDFQVWLILAERMMFIFLLALCFDVRDIEFDKRDQVKTIPILWGLKKTELICKVVTGLFLTAVVIHYVILKQYWGIAIAMLISGILTFFIVIRSYPRRSDYFYLLIADGMMIIQFLLVLIGYVL